MAKTIGPKNINQAREPRPDLGKSLNESTVEKVLSQPDQEQEPLSPVAGAYASADAAAENAEAEDAPAPTPTSEPPHGIDPLSGCSLASAYVNRYRFEGGEMTVKLIFGEGVASNTDTVVRSVLTMSLVDFQRFVHAANQIVAAYRVRPAGAP